MRVLLLLSLRTLLLTPTVAICASLVALIRAPSCLFLDLVERACGTRVKIRCVAMTSTCALVVDLGGGAGVA